MNREHEILKIMNGRTGKQMAAEIGISEPAWKFRKQGYLKGKINKEKLLASKHVRGQKGDPLNIWDGKQRTNKEMTEILDIPFRLWISRKCTYKKGLLSEDALYHIGCCLRGPRKGHRDSYNKNFDGLPDNPRDENLSKIQFGIYDFLGNEPDFEANLGLMNG